MKSGNLTTVPSVTDAHTPSYERQPSVKKRELVEMAYDWAFYGERTSAVFPTGHGGNNATPQGDKAAFAYWIIEDAITKAVRDLAGTPGYQRFWSVRIRTVMVARFKQGKALTPAELGFVGRVLREAYGLVLERQRVFEAA